MRKIFADFMCQIAKKDESVYLIVADIGYGIFDKFRKKFPKRFLNLGICEQSIISVSAGMALSGLKPYVYMITPFLIERPFEQVKLDIDQQKANVKLIGYADYPKLGPTHSEVNGKKLMSLFNNITSYFPKRASGLELGLRFAYESVEPYFISLKNL